MTYSARKRGKRVARLERAGKPLNGTSAQQLTHARRKYCSRHRDCGRYLHVSTVVTRQL